MHPNAMLPLVPSVPKSAMASRTKIQNVIGEPGPRENHVVHELHSGSGVYQIHPRNLHVSKVPFRNSFPMNTLIAYSFVTSCWSCLSCLKCSARSNFLPETRFRISVVTAHTIQVPGSGCVSESVVQRGPPFLKVVRFNATNLWFQDCVPLTLESYLDPID